MRGYFNFNGRASTSFGVEIESYPDSTAAERIVEKITVPGRNGELIRDTGAYRNVARTYSVYIHAAPSNLPTAVRAVAGWLMGSSGYRRLEDNYDPDIYRMAAFSGPVEMSSFYDTHGRGRLSFDCKPQKYLKSGERAISLSTSGTVLYNPGFASLPLITVYGSGAGTLWVEDCAVQIKALDGSLTLDCETQDAYRGTTNQNANIYAPNFPSLSPGDSVIGWDGGITGIDIAPRWWML